MIHFLLAFSGRKVDQHHVVSAVDRGNSGIRPWVNHHTSLPPSHPPCSPLLMKPAFILPNGWVDPIAAVMKGVAV